MVRARTSNDDEGHLVTVDRMSERDGVVSLSLAELEARLRAGGPPTADDVSVTMDGRRLDTKEKVLAWWAEVEADPAAGRAVDLDAGAT